MPALKRLAACVLLVAAAAAAQPSRTSDSAGPANPSRLSNTELFGQMDQMLQALSRITGWPVRRRVPAKTIANDEFKKILKGHVDKADPKKVRAEEITLKMFGLVPDDFSLAKETVDLFGEQVAAFYDSQKKRLFVMDSVSTDLDREVALVHELAHALADQQHSLLKYLHGKTDSDDEATARQAVMEGQATWLTWAYVASRNGGKAEIPPAMLDTLSKSAAGTGNDFPVYQQAPLYFRESLVFPYTEGLKFQDAVFHRLGRNAFEEVFERPPQSTQQIMHPEAYVAKREVFLLKVPRLREQLGKDADQFREISDGDLGEFDIAVLLREYTTDQEGRDEARHLKAAGFRLYEHKRDKFNVLFHQTDWDSPESARRFFEMYQRVLKGKWKKLDAAPASAEAFTGTGDSGKFQVHLRGSSVQGLEGLR
jgi:hypothetical protein